MNGPSKLDRRPDVIEQTRVLNGHSRLTSRIYPRFPLQLEKGHDSSPSHEMRPDSSALHAEQLHVPNQTHKEP